MYEQEIYERNIVTGIHPDFANITIYAMGDEILDILTIRGFTPILSRPISGCERFYFRRGAIIVKLNGITISSGKSRITSSHVYLESCELEFIEYRNLAREMLKTIHRNYIDTIEDFMERIDDILQLEETCILIDDFDRNSGNFNDAEILDYLEDRFFGNNSHVSKNFVLA